MIRLIKPGLYSPKGNGRNFANKESMPTVIVMVENIVVGTFFLKDTLIHPLIGTGQFI